jgi:hypothetical protein
VPVAHQEYSPRPGQHYHCPICRIPLRFDPILNRMTLAPFLDDEPAASPAGDLIPDRRGAAQDRRHEHRGGRRASDGISKR